MTKYLTYYITYLLKKVPNISIFQKEFTIKSLDKKKASRQTLPESKNEVCNRCSSPESKNKVYNRCSLPESKNKVCNRCSLPESKNKVCNRCSLPGLLQIEKPHSCSMWCHLWDFSVKHFLTSSRACLWSKLNQWTFSSLAIAVSVQQNYDYEYHLSYTNFFKQIKFMTLNTSNYINLLLSKWNLQHFVLTDYQLLHWLLADTCYTFHYTTVTGTFVVSLT